MSAAKVTSLCCTFVLIAACSGGAGQASNLRGGPDGIPNSSTDSPGNGNDPPGNSNQDSPGNSNQDSPGGGASDTTCLSCSGVYSCTVPGEKGTALLGLVPGANGCNVIETQGGAAEGALLCGGGVVSNGDSSKITETWSGGDGAFTLTATEDGQTTNIRCVATSQSLPTSPPIPVGNGGGTTDVDAG